MRRNTATTLALLLVLAAPASASANAGLPDLATVELGKYQVEISGDSPTLRTGTNTITIAINDFPVDSPLTLNAAGPAGQVVNVPLQPLIVLSGPADGHDMGGMQGMEGMSGMPGMTGTTASTGHDAPAAGQDSDHEHATASFNVRGKAAINQTGAWKFVFETKDEHGAAIKAEATVDAESGGPSRVYLGFTGLLMAGSITYGAINRRRQPAGGR